MLNRLSNKDRHRQLNVVAWGLNDVSAVCQLAHGSAIHFAAGDSNLDELTGLEDDARLHVPKDVVEVQLHGTAVVVIHGGTQGRHVRIPERLRNLVEFARGAHQRLAPYVHGAVRPS
jgi:hypothetical protein